MEMMTTGRVSRRPGASWRRAVLVYVALLMAACAPAEGPADAASEQSAAPASPLGSYLAARHAQQMRDYVSAADFMDRALARDPENFDLRRRTFALRVSEGHIADAAALAKEVAERDRNAGLAQLVLLLEDVKSGNFGAAAERARALPSEGAQRLATPLLVAWCEMGRQRPQAALQAVDALGELKGVQTLRDLHAALLTDFADRLDDAEKGYKAVIGDQQRLTWRTVELIGNFFERHQRVEEARRLYERLAATDQGSDVAAQALARLAKGEIPGRVIGSARDGVAEALFDLASILDQRETLDASLVYARLALDLRPDFPLAQMLIAEIDEEQHHIADALALYRAVDAKSSLGWSARLRVASALDALDRTDEAAAELTRMAAERPHDPEPFVELGDILRGHSRFAEAVDAYEKAIARVDHIEPRHWRLFYSRAVALERSGQWPRAETDLQRALELQPEQPLSAPRRLGHTSSDDQTGANDRQNDQRPRIDGCRRQRQAREDDRNDPHPGRRRTRPLR